MVCLHVTVPSLVITDTAEKIETIRIWSECVDVPVFAIVDPKDKEIVGVFEAGADGYFTRPIDFSDAFGFGGF